MRRWCHTQNTHENGQCSGLALSKACTDSINVIKSEVFSYAKGNPYISQRLDRKQIVKLAGKNNDDVSVYGAHLNSLQPLLKCMDYVNCNSGVYFFMIAAVHRAAATK